MNNDLKWIADNGKDEVAYYLENVNDEQFILDVRELIKKSTDKELIKELIERLNSYL